jgi:hypothetical protein
MYFWMCGGLVVGQSNIAEKLIAKKKGSRVSLPLA